MEKELARSVTENVKQLLEKTQKELETIIEYKTAGVMLRSKARWIEHGEKNTKYFFNLDRRNYNKKVITKLKRNDGTGLNSQRDILKEEESFYRNLYSSNISALSKEELEEANLFFCSQFTDKLLSEDEKKPCEGEVTEKECLNNLKAMPNGKSPGTDGFPTEFYKVFGIDLKNILLSCYSFAFRTGQLSTSQRRGIISLIPKKDSIPFFLKNWHPISPLNTDYKIVTKCITSRLKQVLPSIVHPDQTGYLKGTDILEKTLDCLVTSLTMLMKMTSLGYCFLQILKKRLIQ